MRLRSIIGMPSRNVVVIRTVVGIVTPAVVIKDEKVFLVNVVQLTGDCSAVIII